MVALMEKIEKEEFFSEIGRMFETHAHHIVGVVTEHYDDKIKLVVEQYVGLREEFDDMKCMFVLQGEKIDSIILDIVIIKNELKKKADVSEVAALDHRVSALETKG